MAPNVTTEVPRDQFYRPNLLQAAESYRRR